MNTMKKNGGFTLVELIIVIAILAILSTGAIAGYSRYINNANKTAMEAILSDIQTSAILANADAGKVGSIVVTEGATSNGKVTLTVVVAPEDGKTLSTSFGANFAITGAQVVNPSTAGTFQFTLSVSANAWEATTLKTVQSGPLLVGVLTSNFIAHQ